MLKTESCAMQVFQSRLLAHQNLQAYQTLSQIVSGVTGVLYNKKNVPIEAVFFWMYILKIIIKVAGVIRQLTQVCVRTECASTLIKLLLPKSKWTQ